MICAGVCTGLVEIFVERLKIVFEGNDTTARGLERMSVIRDVVVMVMRSRYKCLGIR